MSLRSNIKLKSALCTILVVVLCLSVVGCDKKSENKNETSKELAKSTVKVSYEEATIKEGEALFEKYCVQCHSKQAVGNIGPNLTDDYWIHGANLEEILKTIKKGVAEKGMLAFENTLSEKDITAVLSYVESLRSKNLKGKDPQGSLYKKAGDKYVKDETAAMKVAEVQIPKDIPVIPINGNKENGRRLFNITLGCAHCHGTDAFGHIDNRNIKETKNRYGKNWLRVVDYVLAKGREGTAMPSWAHLPKNQLRDVKTFVVSIQQ